MIIAEPPLKLSLSQKNSSVVTVLEYRIIQYPCISTQTWQQRMADGKVHLHDGTLITAQSPLQAQQRIYYYREVENEAIIPFKETILVQDKQILLAYKPHFFTATPGSLCL